MSSAPHPSQSVRGRAAGCYFHDACYSAAFQAHGVAAVFGIVLLAESPPRMRSALEVLFADYSAMLAF